MPLTKDEAVQKLESMVARIEPLGKPGTSSEAFAKWEDDARTLLKYVFPNEPEYLCQFMNIQFTLGRTSRPTTESQCHAAFIGGLGQARAMLQSRIDEVTQFWPQSGFAASSGDSNHSTKPSDPGLVFVIHGRQLVAELHDFLRAIGLRPLEWSAARTQTGKPNPYTWEIVDKALSEAGAIVALLTPDDEARLSSRLWLEHESSLEKEHLGQPRQNVLFEAGVAYGRAPERTVLVRVGSHRPMSDLAGHHIHQLDDLPQSRQGLADALRLAGCPVNTTGTDWYKSGKFSITEDSPHVAPATSSRKRR